jgi:hypothetical protein
MVSIYARSILEQFVFIFLVLKLSKLSVNKACKFYKEISKEIFEKFYLKLKSENASNLEKTIENAVELSSKLYIVCDFSNFANRQKLEHLLFPDGILYNRVLDKCRTPRVNSIFACMVELAKVSENKNPKLVCTNSGLYVFVSVNLVMKTRNRRHYLKNKLY